MAPPAQPPQGGGGNFLTKKAGPLPVWGWLIVAVVGFYLYKKFAGSASGTSSTSSTTVPTETLQTPGGTYTGPVGGAPGSITNPGPGSPTPTPGSPSTPAQPNPIPFATAQNQQLIGIGYGTTGTPNVVESQAGQTFYQIQPGYQVPAGQTVYTEPAPGQFAPLNPSASNAEQPWYLMGSGK